MFEISRCVGFPMLVLVAMLVPVAAFGGLTRSSTGASPLLRCKSTVPLRGLRVIGLSAEASWEAAPAFGSIRRRGSQAVMHVVVPDDDTCDMANPTACAGQSMPEWASRLNELQEQGLGSVALLLATAISLALTNIGSTSRGWLALWSTPFGPPVGGHALSLRGWVRPALGTRATARPQARDPSPGTGCEDGPGCFSLPRRRWHL